MTRLNEYEGAAQPGFGALAMMRSLEAQLALKKQKPSDQAQQLFYDAMEAATEGAQFALLQAALKLDPGNIDALLGVLRHRPVALQDEIELLRKIVALAERRLGPDAFKELTGAFWGFIEARPYMRAREQLAETLRRAGQLEAAVLEWEGMLKLNPGDNQGVRYALLASCLALKRLDEAAALFSSYDECGFSVVFAWGRVLERWLRGEIAEASQALAAARQQNPYMEAYLKGPKRLPKYLPDGYAMGSKEEAICFAEPLRMAWQSHPQAVKWLAAELKRS